MTEFEALPDHSEPPCGERGPSSSEQAAALAKAYDPIRAPWEAYAGPVEGLWLIMPVECSGSTVPVARIDHSRDGYEATRLGAERVARLIAAAPDLLDALTEASKMFRRYQGLHEAKGTVDGAQKAATNKNMADSCDAAIALATGR